jgi:thymidylate synthase (FAD)
MRHRHTTPFEMVEFKFHCKMPIFVARQWIRHRTASVNEYSGRYSILEDDFFRPEEVRLQSATNKQGGTGVADEGLSHDFNAYLKRAEDLYRDYQKLTEQGVSRELARIGLPHSIYTQWYWKIDLHNLLRFLALRMDSHAQEEIRDYANAMYSLVKPLVPHTCEAFEDYELNAVRLTALEVKAISNGQALHAYNKREEAEWAAKQSILFPES